MDKKISGILSKRLGDSKRNAANLESESRTKGFRKKSGPLRQIQEGSSQVRTAETKENEALP